MAEILLPDCQFPRLSDGATCRDIHAETLCQACTAHVQVAALRTRLESAEVAMRNLVAAASADMGIQCSDTVFKRLSCAIAAARAALGAAGEEKKP